MFSYHNDDLYYCRLANDVELRIKRLDGDTAVIHFVRHKEGEAPLEPAKVPRDIVVINERTGHEVPERHDEFAITWATSYTIYRDGGELMQLNSLRGHTIVASPTLAAGTIVDVNE